MAGHIATSKNTDWETPEWILEGVRDVFGGKIMLDPCASPSSHLAVMNWHGPHHESVDGLSAWWSYPNVFVNPPFGRDLPLWVDKVEEETLSGRAVEVILLTPANVDTKIWQQTIFQRAMAIW